ncbi:MAG TPA: response regulator [Verrucomicrobiae bacterium]|jgi:CheY-like chemotaxis protein
MEGIIRKILFVEDEPIAQTVYGHRLEREGFEVHFAGDGQTALEMLATARPDLVVLDLMLPCVPGAEVLKRIRSDEGLKDIPVLILSNAYVTGLTRTAMESGATAGLLKTECTPARLVETVREMLGIKSCFELSEEPRSAEAQMEAFTVAAENAMEDEIVLKKTREEFFQKMPAEVARIRERSLAYIKTAGVPAGREPLNQLHQLVRFFSTRAGMSGCGSLAILASAFEALLTESLHNPDRATPSMSQTIAQALDCLERLLQNSRLEDGKLDLHARILVVDDDAVFNLTILAALKRANFEADCVEDPLNALQMASTDIYDIILLDINMPGINGFELCEKIRKMPVYQVTPIVFVTSSTDFQTRARGILSGGNDLIPKPVSPVELILKITLHLLRPSGAWAETSALASVLKTSLRLLQGEAREAQPPVPAVKNNPPVNHSSRNESFLPTIDELLFPEEPLAVDTTDTPAEHLIESARAIQPADGAALIDAPEKLGLPEMASDEPGPEKSATNGTTEQSPPPEAPAMTVDDLLPLPVKTNGSTQPGPLSFPPATEEIKETMTQTENPAMDIPLAAAALQLPNVIPFPSDPEPKQQTTNMETKPKPTFEEATRGVARIIFGDDNINDMNVRLTRIALERYNVSGTQNTDDIARGVACIIFGDDKISDMNVRLTRIALESYNIAEVLGANGHKKPVENGASHAASSS